MSPLPTAAATSEVMDCVSGSLAAAADLMDPATSLGPANSTQVTSDGRPLSPSLARDMPATTSVDVFVSGR